MTATRLLLILLTAALAWLPAAAPGDDGAVTPDAGTYTVDPVHSCVIFRIRHVGVANFYGRFNRVSGSLEIDPEHLDQSTVKVDIDPASVDTAIADRDTHVKSAELLDVESHPEMGFVSTGVEVVSTNHLEVTGDLTLHGTTRPVTAQVELIGAGASFFGDDRLGAEARLELRRSEFGMDGLIGPLGDEVSLIISLECVRRE